MKRIKRWTALALSAALSAGVLAGCGQTLREIARGIGDHAFCCLGCAQRLQAPVSSAALEGAGPLKRLGLDKHSRRAGLLGDGCGF